MKFKSQNSNIKYFDICVLLLVIDLLFEFCDF